MALDPTTGARTTRKKRKRKPVYRGSDSGEAARFLEAARRRERSEHARTQAARGQAQERAYTDPRAFRSAAGRERLISAAHEEQERRHAREAQTRALALRGLIQNRKAREEAFEQGRLDAEEYQAESAADRRRAEQLGLFKPVESSAASLPIKAIANLAETALYTPAGVYEAGKAVTGDVRDIATGEDFTPSRSAKLGEVIARQTYEDLRHPLRNPGFAALSALGVAAGGAGAVSRLAAAGKAASAASGPSRVAQALARKPSEGGSLLRRPAPGRVQIAEGVHRNLSPNVLAAGAQRFSLGMKKRLPESRMAGVPGRNLQETVGFERRRTEQILSDMDRAEASGLKQRGRKASDVVNRAVSVVGERTPIETRIARHQEDLAGITESGVRARQYRKRLEDEIKLLRQVDESGLIETVDGVPRPTAKLEALYGRTVKSGERREAIIEDLGMQSREQLEARRAAPGRVFEGARFERTPAQSARREHTREYQIPEKQRERPRTEAEAKERLAALDKAYDETVDGIAAQMSGGVHDVGEQARRNLANIKRGKGKRRGKAKLQTVKQELRGMAEERLSQLLETRRSDPEVARVAALVEERQRLRETLSDPERHFGARPATTGEFGQVRYKTPERTMRRRFPERERRPATAGLRGAEDVKPGELFVTYADKRRIKTGRPKPGTERGMGAPRGNILHGDFTGEAVRQGRIPRDVIARVAEGEMEAQGRQTVLRLHETALKESIGPDEYVALPSKLREHHRPVRVEAKPYSPDTRRFLDEIEEKKERGQRLTREERAELNSVTERARAHFFPPKNEMSVDAALAAAEKGEVRFFDQRRFGGMNQPQQPITQIGKRAATVFDEMNSAKDIGDLFLRPAYLPANMAQQAAITLVAGVSPADIALSARLARSLPPELKARKHGASGVGIAEGMPRERGRLVRGARNVMARKIGRVMDDPFRDLAFTKNARMLGYDSPAKVAKLLDPQAKGKTLDDLIEIAKRTRDDMLDYQRLGNQERMVVSRAIRFYPFLKASGVYTGKFVRDHPIQATVLLQLSREGKDAAEEVLGKLPFYRRGMFSTGIDAKGVPDVVDPRAAQMFESPVQAGTLIEGAAKGLGAEVGLFSEADAKAAREKLVPGDLLSPALQAARDLIDPRDRLTGQALTYGQALSRNQRSSVDRFVEKMLINPPDPAEEEGKQLPSSRGIELRRFLAGAVFTPRPANVEELNRAAKEEGAAGLSSEEKAFRGVFQERTAFWEAAKNVAPEQLQGGRLPEDLREAFSRKAAVARVRARVDADSDPGVDRELAKFEAEVKLLGEWGILSSPKVGTALRWAQTAPAAEIVKYRRKLSSSPDYFPGAYLDRILKARNFLREMGADL